MPNDSGPNNPAASYSLAGKRVWVAGHGGMVGSAVVRRLASESCDIITTDRAALDLRRQAEVEAWLAENRPDAVFLAAATVGGILANDTRPAEFLYDNLVIETNIIHGAWRAGIEKLLFLGSACIYPKLAPQPMAEDALLTGPLEPTNEWYAIAKIAGIKLCQAYRRQHECDFVCAMPNNLYGPGDSYDLENSHVIPALIMKIDAAARAGEDEVVIWGSGTPRREFLYVDDLADALVFVMKAYSDEPHLNIGTGTDVTITELAVCIAEVIGYTGRFVYDDSKPDGTPQKLLSCDRLAALGWQARTDLKSGLALAYDWYRKSVACGADA